MNRMIILLMAIVSSVSVTAQTAGKTAIESPEAPKVIGPYSQAIRVGNTYYLSGQIAIDPVTGDMDTNSIRTEVSRIMKNIGAVLKTAGLEYSNIVKTTIFTTDLKAFSIINETYADFLAEPYPARETVQVAALPKNAKVEISVIAVK